MDEVLSQLPPLRMVGMLMSGFPEPTGSDCVSSPLRCNWKFLALEGVGRAVGQQEQDIPRVLPTLRPAEPEQGTSLSPT